MPSEWSGLRYRHVDVFTSSPLSGNGLTVFWDSEGLSEEVMQRLTQEMRQFESIFLMRPPEGRIWRGRIFTMEEELEFAGHPILGAAAALHERHGSDEAQVRIEGTAQRIESVYVSGSVVMVATGALDS